jgi:hypothetical protein
MSLPRGRRAYDRVNASEEEPDVAVATEGQVAEEQQTLTDENPPTTVSFDEPLASNGEGDGEYINVLVMDPAQTKFEIRAQADWTIQKFKEVSMTVHKVPPSSQRLIYRGQMLADQTTLRDAGITKDHTIVHLFPKPRVVVTSDDQTPNQPEAASGGAHIPQIVLDPHEAEMRASILVLGSTEVMEAQNNVKLLSFLLLIMCSMELLALFTIMLGVPDDPAAELTDDTSPPPSGDDIVHSTGEPRTWRNSDYFDLFLSAFGFYVATLGIKATTDNTRALSLRYLIGTVIVGCCWNGFYYYLTVQGEKEADAKRIANHTDDAIPPMTTSDFYSQAFIAILIPGMVWVLCCIRAFQFHSLLREAEQEAEGRIRGELDVETGTQNTRPPPTQELALQNENASLT